jgi:hypothetical protein
MLLTRALRIYEERLDIAMHLCSKHDIEPDSVQDCDWLRGETAYPLRWEERKAASAPRKRIRTWLNALPDDPAMYDGSQTPLGSENSRTSLIDHNEIDYPLDIEFRIDRDIQPGDSLSCVDADGRVDAKIAAARRNPPYSYDDVEARISHRRPANVVEERPQQCSFAMLQTHLE